MGAGQMGDLDSEELAVHPFVSEGLGADLAQVLMCLLSNGGPRICIGQQFAMVEVR